jgi:hypothetical protein
MTLTSDYGAQRAHKEDVCALEFRGLKPVYCSVVLFFIFFSHVQGLSNPKRRVQCY